MTKDRQCRTVGELDIRAKDYCKRIYDPEYLCPTLVSCGGGQQEVKILRETTVRKLTPMEYWRLMGFTDEDFDKVRPITSDRQLYKQAGNSIVVNVLEGILKNLVKE